METINTIASFYKAFKNAHSVKPLRAHAHMAPATVEEITGTGRKSFVKWSFNNHESDFGIGNDPLSPMGWRKDICTVDVVIEDKMYRFIMAEMRRLSSDIADNRYEIVMFNGEVIPVKGSNKDVMQARCQDLIDLTFADKPTAAMALAAGIQDLSYHTPACGWVRSYSGEVVFHLANGTKWCCTGVPVRSTGSHAYEYQNGAVEIVQITPEAVA